MKINTMKKAVEAVHEAAPDVRVFEGRVCTGDQFISSKEQKETITSDFGGMCCEMEGGAIAQACHLNSTPSPDDTESKRGTLRALMNVRMPGMMPADVLQVQDEYLQERIRENGIVAPDDIPTIAENGFAIVVVYYVIAAHEACEVEGFARVPAVILVVFDATPLVSAYGLIRNRFSAYPAYQQNQ